MASSPLPLSSRSFLILHASVTGTSIDVAERIARRGRREGWSVAVKGVSEFNAAELLSTEMIVFVLPTTGNGTAPPTFTPLWTSLLYPELPGDLLEDLRFALFGLGDSSYPKFNWVGRKMFRRMEGLGAKAVVERGEGDDQNEWGIESTFPKWLERFYKAIDPLFPSPEGFTKLSLEDVPPPRIRMEEVVPETSLNALEVKNVDWASDVRWAKITKIERATQEGWFQDVRSLELEIEGGVDYSPGDVLEIRPQNSRAAVDSFLSSIGWTSIADTTFLLTPTSPDQPLPPHLPNPFQTTLRHLLTHELDISSVPRVSFFEWLAAFSTGDMQEKLRWFCEGEGQDDLNDYTHRPRRTIAEVMFEFRGGKVPAAYAFDLLPPLRARGFSIASSSSAHPNEVHLLVAIVNYKTVLSTPRKGVCTSYIAKLVPGDRLPVRFEAGLLKLPAGNPPLIMVGPGTGVAPFRALLEERRSVGAKENLLFFGCRSEEMDFFYKDQWEEMVQRGELSLSVAASRDQEDKIYVQHRIPEYSKLIWTYLQSGGVIYVCGSSTQMPKAVKKAFAAVFEKEGSMKEGSGEKYWDKLEKEGRVVEETWG